MNGIRRSKGMFSEEEKDLMFWHYVVFGGIAGVLSLFFKHKNSFGSPLVLAAAFLTWMIYSFWHWESKRKLLKRCALATPFALLTVILLKLTIFRTSLYGPLAMGVLLFALLTRPAKNLKGGFVISLVTGSILIVLLSILISLINNLLAGPVK